MKIKFKIDKKYDAEMIVGMLQGEDWEYRAQGMGIDLDFAKKVNKNTPKDSASVRKQIMAFADNSYRTNLCYLNKSVTLYQESWNMIINDFSEIIENISVPWFYKGYVCVVTHFHEGLSNWDGNVIARWWKENSYTQRRITAHEILLSHYFTIHRRMYKNSGLSDEQIWALAEIFAFAVTGLEKKVMKFWPWDTNGYYTNHNYPHIVKLQKALKEPYLERKNFDEYVRKGIDLVKKHDLS